MTVLFFDTSALTKRYVPEIGTVWVRKQTAAVAGNDIIIAQITPVELYSAIARQYHDGQISHARLQLFRNYLARDEGVSKQGVMQGVDHPLSLFTSGRNIGAQITEHFRAVLRAKCPRNLLLDLHHAHIALR